MFFLVYKPEGISSFGTLKMFKKQKNIKKIGHTGTLDPLACGLLLVATGNSTKLIPFLEKQKKTYYTTISFLGVSETGDREGPIFPNSKNLLSEKNNILTHAIVQDILDAHFTGKIKQIPPKYSALKIAGKRACDYMREGKTVKISEREVEIFWVRICDFSFPFLTLELKVSAGTYIRTIAQDLGKILGVGAHVHFLERTAIGNLSGWQNRKKEERKEKTREKEKEIFSQILDFSQVFPHFGILEEILEGEENRKKIFSQKYIFSEQVKKLEQGQKIRNLEYSPNIYFIKEKNIWKHLIQVFPDQTVKMLRGYIG